MINTGSIKEKYSGELKALRQRVAELEALEDDGMYKAVFESAGDIILCIDKMGKIMDANKRLSEIGGYEREELIGKNIRTLARMMPKKSMAKIISKFLKRMAGVHVSPYEVELFKKNGELSTFEVSARPLKKAGKIIGDLVILRDVTEHKQVEEALKVLEQNFRNSLDGSLMGIRIGDLEEGTFYANQAFLDIFGYENIEEVRARSPAAYYTPESYADLVLRREKLLRGESVPDNVKVDIVRKDGAIRHLQIFRKDVLWDGKPQYQLIYNDITERQHAEEALKESEEKYRLIVENTHDLIFTENSAGELTYMSPAIKNVLGYNQADIIGGSFRSIIHPEDRAALEKAIQRNVKDGYQNPGGIEFRVRHVSGEWRWYSGRGTALRDANGKFLNFLGIANDITERKQVEEALKASEQNFRNSLDSSSMGIRIVDAEGHTFYVNQAMLDIFGYENIEELRAIPPSENYTPESYADSVLRKEKILRGEPIPDKFEIDIVRKDSAIRHLQVSRKDVFWDGKQQNQLIYNDITERKQSEETLKESEERFRRLTENSPDMITRFNLLPVGHFEYVSPAVKVITGYTPEEYYANPDLNAIIVHPEDKGRRQLMMEKPELYEGVPVQMRYIRKDGRTIWVERRQVSTHDESGKLIALETIIRDITEDVQLKEALHMSEVNFRNTMANSPLGVCVVTADGDAIYTNQKFLDMYGYENLEEFRSKPVEERYTPESYQDYLVRREKLQHGEEDLYKYYRTSIVRKDGAIRYLEVFRKEVLWDGKPQYQLLYNDITERVQAEEALKASEQNFHNSLDTSLMGIRIVGDAGYTFYANQVLLDMFGYKSIDELRASPPQKHYTPESYAVFIQRKEQFSHGEQLPDQLEFDIIRKDGTIRHLQLFSKEVLWDGKLQHQLLYNDITERVQAEEALKASEQNLRNSLEALLIGIRIIDTEGHISYSNQAFLDIFGYKNIDEMRKIPLQERFTPDGYTDYLLKKKGVLRGESIPDKLEIDIVRKDGAIRHVQVFRREVLWDGKMQYQTLYNDITERKQAEEALKASEQNFRNSLDTSLMGIRIVNAEGHILYSNQTFLDIFGYKNIGEMRKIPLQERYTPEAYTDYLLQKERALRGEPVPDKLEIDIVRKDGAIRHLQVFRREILWDGKQQLQVIYNDITQRVEAEKELQRSAQGWQTTFDSITDLISIHDKDNRILRVNKAVADMLKTTPEKLVGKLCQELMHGTKEPPANCPHLQTLKTGKPAVIETYNPNIEAYFHESTSPIFNDKGEITGSVVIARDITQQKRIEEQLIMADRLASIGELSSGVAHELNNPLTSVIGFSQLLMEGDAPDNIKEDLGIIYKEAQRAAIIVKNLLTFARKHTPVKQLSQVNAVIEDVLRLRAYEEKVNNIEVENHLAVNLPEIMMDHFQMQQVFLNIIVNAESAMLEAHHGGKLIITTEKSDNTVKITFTDNGPGIAKENLKRIFDPFFTTKEVGKGTGLGLSICHGIVTEHGGKIYAISENGEGATFVVELPLNAQ